MSPPPDDIKPKDMSDKAARLMGVTRSKSTRDSRPRKVPDPYALDDDDLVMVDGPEDSAKDVPGAERSSGKDRERKRRSKRDSTLMSGALAQDDDAMADAPRGVSDADDLAERPALRRAATSASKKTGLIGGLLGAFSGSRPTPDRRQSIRAYDSEDGVRRKRGSLYEDDSSKRLRREDRRVNRGSHRASDADGLTDAAPMTETEEAEAREARRAERRARKEREAANEEARVARRREKEDRLRREDEEREARKKEERRARRAEREARYAEEDRLKREEEQAAAERRERRRSARPDDRPRDSERRRSYVDRPSANGAVDEDEARRIRREERRLRRSVDPQGQDYSGGDSKYDSKYDRPRASRRRSEQPRGVYESPYLATAGDKKSGGDKTASWVHSLHEDPPPPPPVEGTIVDAPAHFASAAAEEGGYADGGLAYGAPPVGGIGQSGVGVPADALDESTARELRRKQRRERDRERDRYAEPLPSRGSDRDRERRHRRRETADGGAAYAYSRDGGVQRSSDGSTSQRNHERRRSYVPASMGGPVNSLGYGDMGGAAPLERPGMMSGAAGGKRGSWFKKLAGF